MVLIPPVQFDHPYSGPVIELHMTWDELEQVCNHNLRYKVGDVQACTLYFPNFKGDKCYIILPKIGQGGVTKEMQDLLRRHELGHCNGWPRNHPDPQ